MRLRHRRLYGTILLKPVKGPKLKQPPKNAFQLKFPSVLDFSDNLYETIGFFSHLRKLLYRIEAEVIEIDHSTIQRVSPEAALVLMAELVRGKIHRPHCRMSGNSAKDPKVHELLGQIGYWDYFRGMKWEPSSTNSKQFLQHREGNKTIGRIAKELVEHFTPEAKLSRDESRALYAALIECMDNVMKHAYPPGDRDKPFFNQWWLLGCRDSATHEVYFCFFDQGLGIAKTIRTRWKDKLGPLSQTDGALIVKAVVEGHYSSTQDPTRGRGLPRLKGFIDTAQSGRLMIVSRQSRCIFTKLKNEQHDFKTKFAGTLIIWTIQTRTE